MSGKIFPLTQYLTLISNEPADLKALDKRTGSIIKLSVPDLRRGIDPTTYSALQEIVSYFNQNNIVVQNVNSTADIVTGLDQVDVEFYMKTSDGKIPSKHGFLVEVYASGSDGKLTRLYQEDFKDPVDDNNTVEDGFSNYFTIEVID